MPKVRIKVPVCLGNGIDAVPGDIHEVSRILAINLVECDQAEWVEEVQAPREVVINVRDPIPANRDPQKGGRR